jgi:putative glutamine amidotransferase
MHRTLQTKIWLHRGFESVSAMRYKPLIGIAASHNEEEGTFFVRENYLAAIWKAGGIPVMLSQTNDHDFAVETLGKIDGLLLAGGGDVAPQLYGQTPISECGNPDHLRDAFELNLLPEALLMKKPVLGICRGIQVLAVALGGTLIQDIESQCGINRENHYQKPPYNKSVHKILFERESVIAEILGCKEINTNSMHHQAILDPGTELNIEARSEDGIIEAVSMKNNPKVYAVQFHPEYLTATDGRFEKLFKAFIRACID